MACVVWPLLHKYDCAVGTDKVTDSPWQKVVLPVVEIIGAVGAGYNVVAKLADTGELQPFASVKVTENTPVVFTEIVCVTAPLLQSHDDAAGACSTVLPPGQNAAADCAVITGCVGSGFTVTVIGKEVLSQPNASAMVTE
jgi:hypothetical protein